MQSKFTQVVQDVLTGKNTYQLYSLYSKTQWYSEEQMSDFRLVKLKRLITHCYDNVPYYRNFMIGNRIHPDEIKDLTQIALFPIMNKQIIKANYADLMPTNIKHIQVVKAGYTGGTTGEPLKKRTDANTRSSTWGAFRRFYDWMGIQAKDKSLNLMGGFDKSSGFLRQLTKHILDTLDNSISIDTYGSFADNLNSILGLLKNNNISLLRSYPQYAFSLAKEIQQMGYRFPLKAIMTTAEPLFPQHRELFRAVFACETFDQYGCGEIGGIAFECDKHEGLHVTEERVILETNAQGELLMTDLDNFAMPYIRYWNADEADISDFLCSCGRKSKLIKQIRGRVVDYLYGVEGQPLHSSYIWKFMFESGIAQKRKLRKFQVVQKELGHLDFHLVSDTLDTQDKKTIQKYLFEKLGELSVGFFQDDDIENSSSGKYRPIIGIK